MKMDHPPLIASVENIERIIFEIRDRKVILDEDLAHIHGVETKVLNQAVKRNIERFPDDFAFRLTGEEFAHMRSQSVTAYKRNIRHLPYVFTEHGALMAANVLRSERAVQMSVLVVRAFIRLRQILASHAELAGKLEEMERKYDSQFKIVFDAIRQLMQPPEPKRRRIGFRTK